MRCERIALPAERYPRAADEFRHARIIITFFRALSRQNAKEKGKRSGARPGPVCRQRRPPCGGGTGAVPVYICPERQRRIASGRAATVSEAIMAMSVMRSSAISPAIPASVAPAATVSGVRGR